MARMKPEQRKMQILLAAVELAKKCGYRNIKRDEVATAAGVSMGLVNNYFETIEHLKRDVMRLAITNEVLEIIAQGLLAKDRIALKVPDNIKKKAAAYLIG